MEEQFGVIAYKDKGHTNIVFEGTNSELIEVIDIIKEHISETAEIKLIDKDKYDICKRNIIELDKLLE